MCTVVFGFVIWGFGAHNAWSQVASPACFDDTALQALQSGGKTALLYIWSPRMAYSMQNAATAQNAANRAGAQFWPLLSPELPLQEAQAAWSALQRRDAPAAQALQYQQNGQGGLQVLCSNALRARDATLHYPSAFWLQDGQLHPQAIRGALNAEHWQQAVQLRQTAAAATAPQLQTGNSAWALEHAANACVPAHEWVELPEALAGSSLDAYGRKQIALGSYERVSPDGRFILRSYSGARLGQVSVIELATNPSRVLKIYRTPLSNEAFPVQGTWEWLVDVNGAHYRFADILAQETQAKAQFTGGMTGFYAAAAALPVQAGADLNRVLIRSLSWPNANAVGARDDQQGVGMLTSRTITVDRSAQKVVADSGVVRHCSGRMAEDGAMYALPMLAVDGLEFAALPQAPPERAAPAYMKNFRFGPDGKGCELAGSFAFATGKTIFGYASASEPAPLAWEYRRSIYWYHRSAQQAFLLEPSPSEMPPGMERLFASAFPGITADGRVIYAAEWQDCSTKPCQAKVGYVITDPWQSASWRTFARARPELQSSPACITQTAVAQARQTWASRWQWPLTTQP